VDVFEPLRRKRPRWGCVGLAVLVVPCLAASVGMCAATIPQTEAMPREAAMESFDAEAAHALERGFVLAIERDFDHVDDDDTDGVELELGGDECLAALAVTWGHQYGSRLAVWQGSTVVSEHRDPDGRVLHTQHCGAGSPQTLRVVVELAGGDLWNREGQTGGHTHLAIYRAPAAAVGGVAGLDRGRIPDAVLAARPEVMDAADAARPAGRPLAEPLTIGAFRARLIPEDASTYRALYRGAQNGARQAQNPRVTPLPASVPPAWRPGAHHTQESLRHAHAPGESVDESHPAIRNGDDGWVRVLAVVDAGRLGVRCADVQLVRMRYGFAAQAERVAAEGTASRRLAHRGNVSTDRLCAADGVVVYTAPLEDRAPYTLRLFEAS